MENNPIKDRNFPVAIVAFIFAGILFLLSVVNPPSPLQSDKVIMIESGTTLSETARNLKDNGIIKYEFPFEVFVIAIAGDDGVISGEYIFKSAENAFKVARRITRGNYGFEKMKITFPEGSTVSQMADIMSKTIPRFEKGEFIRLSQKEEGYLFPDTYFFPVNTKAAEVISALKENFYKKMSPLEDKIKLFGKTKDQVIIMASIIEKEASNPDDRRIVSGILWKRLKLGIPLQVDATFLYTLGKRSDQLTETDLKTDTPYNTYTRRGLPVAPIGNPGLDAILAAIEPKDSPYLFYLSDNNGEMHYAKNFDGHKINKVKYLR